MNFQTELQKFMKTYQIKQSHIIKNSGLNLSVLQFWLTGRNLPNSYSFCVLCTALEKITKIPRSQILNEFATAILKS